MKEELKLNLDELSFEDIRRHYYVGRSTTNEKGFTTYNNYVKTNLGEITVSDWEKSVKYLIAKFNEEELHKQLKEYYFETAKHLYNEQYLLECHASRIFNDELWVGFIPFNQKYRPEVLRDIALIKVKCECCNIAGTITQKQYERYRDRNECFCPVCGRLSKVEVIKVKTINSFEIRKITMHGFKCFSEKTEINFGNMTIIRGANGLGKSSIADAIAFAFTGSTFFGEKGLDKLCNPESTEMEVKVELSDENEKIHVLTRTRKRDITTISYDGYNVTQTQINELFGDRDMFLSMINPLYFIETMDKSGRELLEKLLPFIKHEDILKTLPEPIQIEMENETILSPETYMKNKRQEIRELEKDLLYLQGQSDLHESDCKSARNSAEQLIQKIEIINNQINELEVQRDSNRSHEDEEDLAELYSRLDELMADTHNETEETELTLISDAIQKSKEEIAKLKAAEYKSSFTLEIAEKSAALKVLYAEYDKTSNLINTIIPGYKCLSCLHEITDSNLQSAKENLQNKLKSCVKAGTAAKTELENIKNSDENSCKTFKEKIAADMESIQAELTILEERYKKAENDKIAVQNVRSETIKKINNDIQLIEYQKENGNLTLEQLQELKDLIQDKRDLETQIEIHQSILDKPGFEEKITKTENQINKLKVLIDNAILYIAKRNEMLFKDLNMNRVKIVLYETIKSTGEIKDTFKFTYNGTEYKRLSLSEKIRAGLEVTELIKKLSKRNYPTFIDNSESICSIDNVYPTGQLIFALVEKGKPLTVTQKETVIRKAG